MVADDPLDIDSVELADDFKVEVRISGERRPLAEVCIGNFVLFVCDAQRGDPHGYAEDIRKILAAYAAKENASLKAEVERLRGEIEQLQETHRDTFDKWQERDKFYKDNLHAAHETHEQDSERMLSLELQLSTTRAEVWREAAGIARDEAAGDTVADSLAEQFEAKAKEGVTP